MPSKPNDPAILIANRLDAAKRHYDIAIETRDTVEQGYPCGDGIDGLMFMELVCPWLNSMQEHIDIAYQLCTHLDRSRRKKMTKIINRFLITYKMVDLELAEEQQAEYEGLVYYQHTRGKIPLRRSGNTKHTGPQ